MLHKFIVDTVLTKNGISIDDIKRRDSKEDIAMIRHSICYFLRTYTKLSLVKVGDIINRDHSTVLYSVRVIRDQLTISSNILDSVFYNIENIIINHISEDIAKEHPLRQLNRNMESSLIDIYNICKTGLNKKNMSTKLKEIEKICEKYKE